MTFEQINKLAGTGQPMPEELNGAEQLAFLSLRLLHTQYIADKMDIEQARLEKVRIAKQLEVNLLSIRTWEAAMAKERKLSTLTPQLKDSGCPLCRRFFYTLSGYKTHEKDMEDETNEPQGNL